MSALLPVARVLRLLMSLSLSSMAAVVVADFVSRAVTLASVAALEVVSKVLRALFCFTRYLISLYSFSTLLSPP